MLGACKSCSTQVETLPALLWGVATPALPVSCLSHLQAVIPVLILAVYHASAYCARNFGHTQLWRKYGVKAHAWLTSHQVSPHIGLQLCCHPSAEPLQCEGPGMQRQALQVNAISEVGTGIFLMVLLVTPQRNFMTLFLYFNFLRMRYFSPDAAAYHREVSGLCVSTESLNASLGGAYRVVCYNSQEQ